MYSADSINIKGSLFDLSRPRVMGILNATPDSFYSGSRTADIDRLMQRAGEMAESGVDIFDLGGYSTRPGADDVSQEEELPRLTPAIDALKKEFPGIPVSIDTFRASVARECVENHNADIINDVSGGSLDPEMFSTVAQLRVPYILMHMRGTPADMQSLTDYEDVVSDVIKDLAAKADRLHSLGVADIIIDPGFGFAKTIEQNYRLLASLKEFRHLGMPLLAGMSRKSMIWKPLGITPEESLPGTIALHTAAILAGASIIRVHDVAPAVQATKVTSMILRSRDEESFIK